jgi:hypothetical protein
MYENIDKKLLILSEEDINIVKKNYEAKSSVLEILNFYCKKIIFF